MSAKFKIGDIIYNKGFTYEIWDVKWFPNNKYGYKVICLDKPEGKPSLDKVSFYKADEIEAQYRLQLNFNYNKLWAKLNES